MSSMTFPSLRILVGTIQLGFFTLLKRFCHSFRVKQTRFERSENRVCVTSLWKGTFGFFPTQLQLRPKLVTILRELLLHPFLPFLFLHSCNWGPNWWQQLRELLLHVSFFSFFSYIAAIEAQIGDNTKELLLHPFLPFLFLHSCNWGPNWWQH